MPRIPVPDDFDAGHISVAGTDDYHYGQADVNTEAVSHARDVSVREDDDGRYVGPSGHYADEIAEYLGVDLPGDGDDSESDGDDDGESDEVTESDTAEDESSGEDSDAQPESVTQDADHDTNADLIENGECPWCGSEYENVGSHASQAHPDEYTAYKEARE